MSQLKTCPLWHRSVVCRLSVRRKWADQGYILSLSKWRGKVVRVEKENGQKALSALLVDNHQTLFARLCAISATWQRDNPKWNNKRMQSQKGGKQLSGLRDLALLLRGAPDNQKRNRSWAEASRSAKEKPRLSPKPESCPKLLITLLTTQLLATGRIISDRCLVLMMKRPLEN